MLATVVATLLSSLLSRDSIYTLKLSRRGVHLKQGQDVDVLQTISVAEIMSTDFQSVDETISLEALAEEFSRQRIQSLMVGDEHGDLTGMVTLSDLDRALATGDAEAATAADIATSSELLIAHPEESIGTAMRRLGLRDVNRLPVRHAILNPSSL